MSLAMCRQVRRLLRFAIEASCDLVGAVLALIEQQDCEVLKHWIVANAASKCVRAYFRKSASAFAVVAIAITSSDCSRNSATTFKISIMRAGSLRCPR